MEFSIGQVGPVQTLQTYVQTNIYSAASVSTPGPMATFLAATLQAGSLQSVVLDWVGTMYGTIVGTGPQHAGSIQVSLMAIEPQTRQTTATLVAGGWYAAYNNKGSLVGGERLMLAGPVGGAVGVQVVMGAGVGLATESYVLTPVSMTAQQATGGR